MAAAERGAARPCLSARHLLTTTALRRHESDRHLAPARAGRGGSDPPAALAGGRFLATAPTARRRRRLRQIRRVHPRSPADRSSTLACRSLIRSAARRSWPVTPSVFGLSDDVLQPCAASKVRALPGDQIPQRCVGAQPCIVLPQVRLVGRACPLASPATLAKSAEPHHKRRSPGTRAPASTP